MTEQDVSKWIKEQLDSIKEDSREELINCLSNTTDVLRQLYNNPDSLACKTLAVNCVELNTMLINELIKEE
ncbi:hypothetical protein Nekkels1_28 [Cellulophaga phage Nekkels_1]|uniref:Uncharacterized protein n=1 Tax=Cellulophaga phage Nekkels_1 TaxID=2745692 RepID=A0A8E4UXG1_9CAUD|nr:hypothetical protein M1M31_gp28 [Cellulophaga phage Nekkels_1]QQO97028.1 hypothetical protein Nekkels1_28 [Cellulophaga phage Nekkels_1]QQO97121.1 hypothetical protein Nekkels2_28 [Cellulophaga phage Nekkels_2]